MTEKEILEKLRNDCENAAPDRFSDIRKLIENNNNAKEIFSRLYGLEYKQNIETTKFKMQN